MANNSNKYMSWLPHVLTVSVLVCAIIISNTQSNDRGIKNSTDIKEVATNVNNLASSIKTLVSSLDQNSSNSGKQDVKIEYLSKEVDTLSAMLILSKKNTNGYIDKNSDRGRVTNQRIYDAQMYNSDKRDKILWYLLEQKNGR